MDKRVICERNDRLTEEKDIAAYKLKKVDDALSMIYQWKRTLRAIATERRLLDLLERFALISMFRCPISLQWIKPRSVVFKYEARLKQ